MARLTLVEPVAGPVAGTVLANLEWLIRNRDAIAVNLEIGMILVGDGGFDVECLSNPGFTPATRKVAA
jgi:hypothetical protein